AAPITINISHVGGQTDAGSTTSGDGPGALGTGGKGDGSGGGGGGAAPDEPKNFSTSGKDSPQKAGASSKDAPATGSKKPGIENLRAFIQNHKAKKKI
ncbi:MAG TPA: hypothetical protein VIJ14_06215, partial [Rhabdochlamydiaceae bacterium]